MQRDLAVRAREGDHDAFNALAAASIGRLFGIAALILRDRDLAEDATQEALVIAWRDIRGLRQPESIDAWLNRLVVRACYRQRKRERRQIAVLRVAPETEEPSSGSHELSIAQRDQIDRGYARLDLDQRAVLVLYHHIGMPLSEVAEILAIPVGTGADERPIRPRRG